MGEGPAAKFLAPFYKCICGFDRIVNKFIRRGSLSILCRPHIEQQFLDVYLNFLLHRRQLGARGKQSRHGGTLSETGLQTD